MSLSSKSSHRKPGSIIRKVLPSTPPVPRAPAGKYITCKIVVDYVLATLLLLMAAPVLLLSAALVKLTSRGPALYTQKRLGLNGRPFAIYKLRTMFHDCERTTGPRWAVPGDARITSVGRWLRFTHLDELPQLWNVLRGEMSLVGPRPERPEIVAQLQEVIPNYARRLLLRPGLTGLAQVQLPADLNLECVRRKLTYDLFYLEHLGLGLDLRILLSTSLYVLGASAGMVRLLFWLPDGSLVQQQAAMYRAV